MLKIFIDDSGVNQTPVYVLAGHIANVDTWLSFTNEWSKVLRMSPSVPYFTMSDAMNFNGPFNGMSEKSRDEKLALLMSVKEEHKLYGVSTIMLAENYDALFRNRLPKDIMDHPYYHLFLSIITSVLRHQKTIGSKEKVEFIFDEQRIEEDAARKAYRMFVDLGSPEFKERVGARPHFQDDKEILPLQAADMEAWWVRQLYEATLKGVACPVPPWGVKPNGEPRGSTLRRLEHAWTPKYFAAAHKAIFGYEPSGYPYQDHVMPMSVTFQYGVADEPDWANTTLSREGTFLRIPKKE